MALSVLERDKLRIHTLLKKERGAGFTAEEMAATTGLDEYRVKAAGDALAASGLIKLVGGYYLFKT